MLGMVIRSQGPIERHPLAGETLPRPEPHAGEILVRVSACGLCRTDLHVIEGDLPLHRCPLVPGHQVVGRVARAGPGTSRFRTGERVGIAWLRFTCGACPYCRRDAENLCANARFTGWDADGGFAEFAVVPEAFAYAIPDVFTDVEAAPLLCAGIIGYRALKRSGVRPGERLALYGFGSSAHVTLQVARAWGCEVLVATRESSHRELARSLGASWVGDLGTPLPAKANGAILFAPAGELVPRALENLDHGGTLVLAGIYMTDVPPLPYESSLFHERTITSVTANTRADGEELLREAARIPIRTRTTTFPLTDANVALQSIKQGTMPGSGVLVLEGDHE